MYQSKTANRHYLLCPRCLKTQANLSVHLRRVCLKDGSDADVNAIVDKAKHDAAELLQKGRIFKYSDLTAITSDENTLKRLVEELKRHHLVVTGEPCPPAEANTEPATSTSEESSSAALGEGNNCDSSRESASSSSPNRKTRSGTAAKSKSESAFDILQKTIAGPKPHRSTSTRPTTSLLECHQEAPDDIADEAPDETQENIKGAKYSAAVKQSMYEKGLYNRHSLDHPLLQAFAMHLNKEKNIQNYKQEVENVSRFLYFVNNEEASLQFVYQRQKLDVFLKEITGLTKRTQSNYLKSLKRFLNFHTDRTNLHSMDADLHEECTEYSRVLTSTLRLLSKQAKKEIFQKRHAFLMDENALTTEDCQVVLVQAKDPFLACMDKLSEDDADALNTADKTLVLYYLEAVVILGHVQRPSVVQNMTVSEWLSRDKAISKETGEPLWVVGVKEHKTSTQQVATFALSKEEEHWFDLYYKRLRPVFQRAARKRKRDEDETDPKDFFFLSSVGKQIHRPSTDLSRLEKKFAVPAVTSQMARRFYETATKDMPSSSKTLVASYLTHTNATAEQHYRYKTTENMLEGKKNLTALAVATSSSEESSSAAQGNDSDSSRERASSSSPNRKTRSGTAHKLKSESAFDILQKKFPVTITGSKPHRSLLEVDDVSWRKAYKYWLHGQQKLRQEYVRSKFPWRQPSTKSLQKLIKNQGWDGTTNTMQLLRRWIPSGSGENIMDCTAIQKLEKNQRWKGLRTQQSEGQGTSVMAKRKFRVGEVVCDYHAAVVTVSDGKEDSRCDCHTKQPPGKLIKYSENNSNVTPKHCPLVLNGEKMHVTLFLATKIISTDEEVLLPLSFKGTL
ncbi:unnamed protein product [Gadus morhua 'NCC']